jgi:hypothetical protein
MNPAQYAEHRGKELRTVRRWLKDGWLPGAVQYPDGRWDIPRDAIEQKPLIPPTPRATSNGQAVSPVASGVVSLARHAANGTLVVQGASSDGQGLSLAEALDKLPAFLTVRQAARLLGISAARIKDNPRRFQAEPIGRGDSLMVPAKVVRETAGIYA